MHRVPSDAGAARMLAARGREEVRTKGQIWTPAWVADAMVEYCLAGKATTLFDPAVGAGAFFRAARRRRNGRLVALAGCEIDSAALDSARLSGVTRTDLRRVAVRDFVLDHSGGPYAAIVGNPPYVRHHRLAAPYKARLRSFAASLTGASLDGRAGLHVYFLLRALALLAPDGRLAFIVPADTAEGVFAPGLWSWIAARFRIDAVVTFDPAAAPFPGVDTNAMILLISRRPPVSRLVWARCSRPGTVLCDFVQSGFASHRGVWVRKRALTEALATGLSRAPERSKQSGFVLGDCASVKRGVATGANEFFFLTDSAARAAKLPRDVLLQAIGRTRDVPGDTITPALMRDLSAAGRPTLLLSLAGDPPSAMPRALRMYLERGEHMGLHARALISTRKPWYRMETRPIPPFLFAYLGRRRVRFIRNSAGVVPLTGFLCIYPRRTTRAELDWLWRVLSHPSTVANLRLVGKSYGGGAIKVEPRALERLPITRELANLRPDPPHPVDPPHPPTAG